MKATVPAEFQPLYAQVKDFLLQRIASGIWLPGCMLPNEFELAAECKVSQGTVRKALLALEADKLIIRHQGKGTYVAQHTKQKALYHFFRLVGLDDRRKHPTSIVLETKRQKATKAQATALETEPGAMLHAITRLRHLDGEAAVFERIFIPVALMPGLNLPSGPQSDQEMYVIYQQDFKTTINRASERLAAVAATEREAQLLGIQTGDPLLEITRVARDVLGRAVELRISRVNTAQCRYASDVS